MINDSGNSEEKNPSGMQELVREYRRNTNIMELLRNASGKDRNTADAILISYDLQSGSYLEILRNDPEFRKKKDHVNAGIAEILGGMGGGSLLEVGVGEGSTLGGVAGALRSKFSCIGGFDISWSRVAYAQAYFESLELDDIRLWTGDIAQSPLVDSAFDVVYTAHSLEPNGGRERECLAELYRITAEWLVLIEPADELGNEQTKARIQKHGYCQGLAATARELGFEIVDYRLFQNNVFDFNQSHQIIIQKPRSRAEKAKGNMACPVCKRGLEAHAAHLFCKDCLKIYPVVQGIPCLLPGNGILATKFLDFPIREGVFPEI